MARRKSRPANGPEKKEYLSGILFGICISLVVLSVLVLVLAFVLSMVDISSSVLNVISIVLLIITGFTAGIISARRIFKNGIKIGLFTGACLALLLLVVSGIVTNGIGFECLSKMLVLIVSSTVGGVLGVNTRKKYH